MDNKKKRIIILSIIGGLAALSIGVFAFVTIVNKTISKANPIVDITKAPDDKEDTASTEVTSLPDATQSKEVNTTSLPDTSTSPSTQTSMPNNPISSNVPMTTSAAQVPNASKDSASIDMDTCKTIINHINAAASNEAVYKEIVLALNKTQYFIFEVKVNSTITTSAGTNLNGQLASSLQGEITAPTETGKNTYYVLIQGLKSGSIVSIKSIKAITGKTGIKPALKDFL